MSKGRIRSTKGNCYVTCEAIYHLTGGNAQWTPCTLRHEGLVHWYLKHKSGYILDPTIKQFKTKPSYSLGRGRGFLTKDPSKRAKRMMEIMLWQKKDE